MQNKIKIDSCFQSEDFKRELAEFRKYHYKRGFAVGSILSLMVAGVLFVLYCRAILAII